MTTREQPQSASGGLEPAVEVPLTAPVACTLAALRRSGAALAVTVDSVGHFRTVVPLRTLEVARPRQQISGCKPAWSASVFIEPGGAVGAENLASHSEETPGAGRRTVVVRAGHLMGVVPVPSLIDRPGLASRLLETAIMRIGWIIARIRYRRHWTKT